MISLQELKVNNNPRMGGEIPSSIGSLENLAVLYASNNNLSGTIPTEFSNLSNLQYFVAFNNKLTGSFPSIEKLKKLRT